MKPLRPARGFTLVEASIACAVVALVGSLALPGLFEQLRRARRVEAYALLGAAQHAQEQRRGSMASYTRDLSHQGVGLPEAPAGARYVLSVDQADARGYTLTASARAGTSQAGDGPCARLRIRVAGGFVFHGSAPLGSEAFDESVSNRCWGP